MLCPISCPYLQGKRFKLSLNKGDRTFYAFMILHIVLKACKIYHVHSSLFQIGLLFCYDKFLKSYAICIHQISSYFMKLNN